MTYTIHPSDKRGSTQIDWLDSRHTFSFGHFRDSNRMGFRSLRVINDDRVNSGGGFAPHSHRDMEIITYVLDGELEHKDSLGNGAVIRPGEAQIMSAGTGITHSEYNPSSTNSVHLLQIWILPDTLNLAPRYDQKEFPLAEKRGKLRLIGAKDGRDGAVVIHQNVDLYVAVLESQETVTHQLQPNRHAWLQVAKGEVTFDRQNLQAGDGVAISDRSQIEISSAKSSEILLFDLN
jgi:quercetin 2,3-dioxygenase